MDEFECGIAHPVAALGHCRAIHTTYLVAHLFLQRCRFLKAIPNAFSERVALMPMFRATTCAAERWGAGRITKFEFRQTAALRCQFGSRVQGVQRPQRGPLGRCLRLEINQRFPSMANDTRYAFVDTLRRMPEPNYDRSALRLRGSNHTGGSRPAQTSPPGTRNGRNSRFLLTSPNRSSLHQLSNRAVSTGSQRRDPSITGVQRA
jgi:hypothetical protein